MMWLSLAQGYLEPMLHGDCVIVDVKSASLNSGTVWAEGYTPIGYQACPNYMPNLVPCTTCPRYCPPNNHKNQLVQPNYPLSKVRI